MFLPRAWSNSTGNDALAALTQQELRVPPLGKFLGTFLITSARKPS
jgi:hypothetical protein